jgi:hypothetical protein
LSRRCLLFVRVGLSLENRELPEISAANCCKICSKCRFL